MAPGIEPKALSNASDVNDHFINGTDLNGDGKPDFQRVLRIEPASASGDMEFHFDERQ
jgi:hypothetical protein